MMRRSQILTLVVAFFLLLGTGFSFALSDPPRTIWKISGFSGGNFFDGFVFVVGRDDVSTLPYEFEWRRRNITLYFDLQPGNMVSDKFEFRFYVPYMNYGEQPNVILNISAGYYGETRFIVSGNYTVDHLGWHSIMINSSYFRTGNNNYINIYGVNIDCVGYGCLSPNFQWNSASMSLTGNPAAPNITDIELLDKTEAAASRYFYEQALPNGFVKDTATSPDSSMAATGFGLTAFTIMANRYDDSWQVYWNTSAYTVRYRTNQILDRLLEIQSRQATDPNRYGVAGFFYHFVNSTGERSGTSEVSTVDSAILVAGALTAGEYFGGEIKQKAETIFSNMNWSYFYDSGKKQFSHGWNPESGVFAQTWDRPSDETMLVTLLAIASQPNNTEFQKSFYSWPRVARSYVGYNTVNSYFGSAFTYEFAHVWFDFKRLGYDSPASVGSAAPSVNWWNNSMDAMLASRQFSIDNASAYSTYGNSSWGLTACQKPSGAYEGRYGAKPCEYNGGNCYHDGTICPYGSISAISFFDKDLSKNLAFQTLRNYYDKYYWDLWGEYGPRDSFDSSGNFNTNYLGIDVGPEAAMIENYRTGMITGYFMSNERIRNATKAIFPNQQEPGMLFYESFDNLSSILSNKGNLSVNVSFMPGIRGNALNFTCVNPYYSGGQLYCYYLNNTYVSYPLQDNFNIPSGTIEFWIKPQYQRNSYGFFDIGRLYGTNPNSMGIFYNVNHAITEIRANNTGMTQAWSSTSLSGPYPWHHVAVTWYDYKYGYYGYGCYKIITYLDGIPGSYTVYCNFYPDLSREMWIGNNYFYGHSYSLMDEFKILDYAKSEAQIKADYDSGIKTYADWVNANTPQIDSYSPQSNVTFAGIGELMQFSISASDPSNSTLTARWYLNNLPVSNSTDFSYTTNHIGHDTISVNVSNGLFSIQKAWYVIVRNSTINIVMNGAAINNTLKEWTFNLSSDWVKTAQHAVLTINWNDGLYSKNIWQNTSKNGAVISVNAKQIEELRPEFYCNGKYFGHRCDQKEMKLAIPMSSLNASTKISISLTNAFWNITKLVLTVNPNENIIIADKKIYLDGEEFVMKGVSYAPWFLTTGPEPYQKPFPAEYENVTALIDNKSVVDYNRDGKIQTWEVIEYDLDVMRKAGINNIRTYASGEWHDFNLNGIVETVSSCNKSELLQGDVPNWLYDRVLRYALQNNMSLSMGYWVQEEDYNSSFGGSCGYFYTNEYDLVVAEDTLKRIVERYGDNPAVLAWGIGNEVHLPQNQGWFYWQMNTNLYLNALCNYTKNISSNKIPVMYAKYIGEDVSFSSLPCYDIIAPNMYIFPANDARIQNEFSTPLPPEKTYAAGEFGHIIEHAKGQWELAVKYAGGDFLEYNSVWWKGDTTDCPNCNEMGIVNAKRMEKPERFNVLACLYNPYWPPGDVITDRTVNIFDLAAVGLCFGKAPTGSCAPADVNKDGRIDIFDLATVGKNFGRFCQ